MLIFMGIIKCGIVLFGNALDLSPELEIKFKLLRNVVSILPSKQFDFTNGHRYDLKKHIVKFVEPLNQFECRLFR